MKLIIDIDKQTFDKLTEYGEPLSAGNGFHDSILKAVANGKPYEERPQSKWQKIGEEYYNWSNHDKIKCKKCGYIKDIVWQSDMPNFCENCGAKMKKGGAE